MRAAALVLLVAFSWTPSGVAIQAPATPASHGPNYRFTTPAGVLYFHVRPDRATDFEAVVTRMGEVLDQSADPVRRQQAASWRVWRSTETGHDSTVYMFFFDPVVSGADYDPVKILGEGLPTEVHALYERLKAATIRIERMALQRVR
jgi:hypothetical protein